MVVSGVSVADPDDDETFLQVVAWAKEGRVGLAQGTNSSSSLEVEEGADDDDGDGHGSLVLAGNETAMNLALAGLVYFPPPDWTSFKHVRDGLRYHGRRRFPTAKESVRYTLN